MSPQVLGSSNGRSPSELSALLSVPRELTPHVNVRGALFHFFFELSLHRLGTLGLGVRRQGK